MRQLLYFLSEMQYFVCEQMWWCLEEEVQGGKGKEFGWHCFLYYQKDGKPEQM